jgi:hypothetical protein
MIFILLLIIICILLLLINNINFNNKNYTLNIKLKNIDSDNNDLNCNNQINLEKIKLDNELDNELDIVLDNELDIEKNNKIKFKKINPEILNKLDIKIIDVENFLLSSNGIELDEIETFLSEKQKKLYIPDHISFKNIKSNKLYYGLPCDYIKNDCFYDALKINNFIMTKDILKACLIVPCSYETTEKEIEDLDKNKISLNEYGEGVRIFMLNNTDHMVSKLALWKYLKQEYGEKIASSMLPYTWDLTDLKDVEKFKLDFNKNKIYITKNNLQRQEGIEIHTNLNSIISTKNKYLLVQELLQDPYLILGRKINLRVYVLVIKDNYSNIKLNIYKDGFIYYTAELFEYNNSAFKKNITTGYVDRQIYLNNPLTHMDFRKWLDDPKRELTQIEKYIKETHLNIKLSDYIFSQIYEQLGFIFKTYEDIIGTKTNGVNFQLYGVDVAINNHLNPIVMEINKGPDLSSKDIIDKKLKINLCTDILKSVGLLDNVNNDFITILEKVNINGNNIYINNLIEY